MTTTAGGVARAASWLGLALFATALLNGVGPYLRRTGLIERERYERFWELHTGPSGYTTSPLGLGRRCARHRAIEDGGAEVAGGGLPARYVHAVRRWEAPLKALKDLVVAALVLGSAAAWAAGRSAPPPVSRAAPLLAVAALVAWQAAAGLVRGAPLETLAGLRGFGFVAIALVAGWAGPEVLRRLAPWLVALLVVQLVLAPLELLRGIPVQGHAYAFGEAYARRAAGTFVMPNTLGAFAGAAVALAAGFGETRRLRALAWGAGGLVVLLSGSATGLAMLAAVALAEALQARGRALHRAAVGLLLAATAVALVRARPDVLDSVAARLRGTAATMAGPLPAVFFGRGLGTGSNASVQLRTGLEIDVPGPGPAGAAPAGAESAVSALVLQVGVAGAGLVAVSLLLAWRRCGAGRALVAALGLAGLTLVVPEAFPLNVLLGLVLAVPGGERREGPGEVVVASAGRSP